MALFSLEDYMDFDTIGVITATSWEAALDPDFTQIIDSSYEDKINIREWYTKLPVIGNTNGSCYSDLSNVYGRVKIHIDDVTSPWYELAPLNQNDQVIKVRELNRDITIYDALADNFN